MKETCSLYKHLFFVKKTNKKHFFISKTKNSYSANLPQGGYIVRAFADGKQSKLKVLVK